jgi:hypothetical protein
MELIMPIDEATQEALAALRGNVSIIRHDIGEFKDDFKRHTECYNVEITAIRLKMAEWNGAVKLVAWMVAVLLAVVSTYIAKHW